MIMQTKLNKTISFNHIAYGTSLVQMESFLIFWTEQKK